MNLCDKMGEGISPYGFLTRKENGPLSLAELDESSSRLIQIPWNAGVGRRPRCPVSGHGGEVFGVFRFAEDVVRGDHGDDIPGAYLGAELAADADRKVDRADAHRIAGMSGVGDLVDAIDRAHGDTCVATGTQILVEDGQLFRELLFLCHWIARRFECRHRRFARADRYPNAYRR